MGPARSAGRDHLCGHHRRHLAATAAGVRPVRPYRFTEWSVARVWAKLHRLVVDELGARGELDWSRCAIDSVSKDGLDDGGEAAG